MKGIAEWIIFTENINKEKKKKLHKYEDEKLQLFVYASYGQIFI